MIDYWVLLDEDDGKHYRTGKVIEFVGDGNFMVKIDRMNGPVAAMEMISRERAVSGSCFFFQTETEMHDWIKWLDTPEGEQERPRVVPFKKNDD